MKKLISLLIILSLAGCSSYRNVNIHHDTAQPAASWRSEPPLSEGDSLQYKLKNGSKGAMIFHTISDNALIGQDGAQVPLDQVATLERKEFSGGKTAAATGAGVGVAAVVVVVIASVGLATALIAAGG